MNLNRKDEEMKKFFIICFVVFGGLSALLAVYDKNFVVRHIILSLIGYDIALISLGRLFSYKHKKIYIKILLWFLSILTFCGASFILFASLFLFFTDKIN